FRLVAGRRRRRRRELRDLHRLGDLEMVADRVGRAYLGLLPARPFGPAPLRHGRGRGLRAQGQQILGGDDHRLGNPADRGRLGLYRLLEARMTVDTPLAQAATGPAHEAARHWGLERMLSVSTLLLFAWFLAS